ncbi:MarR family EPS-associated transcriptional regulator [Roseibacterium sp. SDUM158016]|uniref:MarR family EPS-associated transcriptional regulator n=1 Tax=Roseicyclus sediminis TaxID=2980997 RepID=UPI0021CF75C0|nr:MarR family EPS-associated transcriptional regulator [Roseibacterium sp. SDUM158016]MCU4653750.1 MarR family EPS-associated transcriptional regulator [Roseibacterium sp. SDUM158016]
MRLDDDARFRIMRLIEANPDISQRKLARELGISLGGVNYCLNALIEKGLVKMERFRVSENKLAYVYVLTPRGASEKAMLTRGFLARKMDEYELLRAEIESIRQELSADAARPDERLS